MPFAKLKENRVHYDVAGPQKAPVLVFSNSLGTDFSMWDPQARAFSNQLRVVRYDTRGHGKTSVTPGPYSFDQLGEDVLHLVDSLKIDEFSFCGLSMGGLTGMWLGLHAPQRVRKLVLCSTAAKIGTAETWNARIAAVRKQGMKSIAQAAIERWFTQKFREKAPEIVARTKRAVESTSAEGYIANCEALRDADFRQTIAAIRTPVLVISGTHDPATPPADGQFVAGRIPGAHYVELDAAHLCNIEAKTRFNAELTKFLS